MICFCTGEAPNLVSVPTHFFKVVLGECKADEAGEENMSLGAFVMPNAPIDPEVPLTAFTVPLHQLEAISGQSLIPLKSVMPSPCSPTLK